MPLYDYFRAADHDQARATALRPGGPLGRDGAAGNVDGLALKNLDPLVAMGRLLALVRAVEWSVELYELVDVWPTSPRLQADDDLPEESPWMTGPWVHDLGTAFRDSFAGVDDGRLPEISEKWQAIEELRGSNASARALGVAESFVALARRARDADQSIYCWSCL